jgi:hypothetical protein
MILPFYHVSAKYNIFYLLKPLPARLHAHLSLPPCTHWLCKKEPLQVSESPSTVVIEEQLFRRDGISETIMDLMKKAVEE